MRILIWDSSFRRAFKRVIRKKRQLEQRIFDVLELLADNPLEPVLKTHKLRG